MYDQKLNRQLTDADLPLGITVDEMKAVLAENHYSFFALGTIPAEGSSMWTNDPTVFRVSTHDYPARGATISFEALRKAIDDANAQRNINEADVITAVEEASQTAVEVLSNAIPFGNTKISDGFVQQLSGVMKSLLKGEAPAIDNRSLTRIVKDWPVDVVAKPVTGERWEMRANMHGNVMATRDGKPSEADEVYAAKCNATWQKVDPTVDVPVMTKAMLQRCPYCQSVPVVSENNVPGNWYGLILCDNGDCEERPSVLYGGTFADAVDEVAEWNMLPLQPSAVVSAQGAADEQEKANREREILAMAAVLEECRWFDSSDPAMEVRSLVFAQRLWEAAHQKKSPVEYGSKFDCPLAEQFKTKKD
ncbi:hypothetical protein [Rhizobium sp. MHM7A]|uniref:hypothetical protein n=1 Tax=Rhizobium sp. MHM7A TaxID=2583233 RepID=UPI0011071A54|nr:hypothetical protein [Rhizobium sp. MHM7A]TLX16414.1 hypothetical protein FFR93_03515 [Rhizobium sp. MHM7A]